MTKLNPETGLDCVSAGAVRRRQSADADQTAERKDLAGDQTAEQVKHTPGPWHFVEENAGLMMDHGYGILYGEPDAWGWEQNLYVSVGCSLNVERKLGKGAAAANARLIAAAPDMLAACKEFIRKVEAGEAKSKRSYAQMKAAVAKAEGWS